MRYVRVPTQVSSADVLSEGFCFSPARYTRFIPPPTGGRTTFEPLDQLVTVREEVERIGKGSLYRYAEIGDIDVDTGGVHFRVCRGFRLPSFRLQRVHRNDVLISTVRTYRKGIGLVTEDDATPLIATNAILTISGVSGSPNHIDLPYVYAFLRTDFFVEQVWSLLNRGLYPRMDVGALHRVMIPIADSPRTCRYVSALVQAIADKERAIRERNNAILQSIATELSAGQRSTRFKFEYPRLHEVQDRTRFDAAIYSHEYKSKVWLVENYGRGYLRPTQAGFTVKPGPSLEIKILRTRIDSDTPKPGFYTLLIPANISEYGTMSKVTWLGTGKKLPLLQQGDVLFGEAGFGKGRTIVLIDGMPNATTNAHGLYARRADGDLAESIFFRCIFHWYRSMRLIDLMAVGGSGGHFSPEYFDSLLIPRFPDEIKSSIVRLYHSPAKAPPAPSGLSSFVSYHRVRNENLGIWELDREMKALQAELATIQEQIIQGKTVSVPLAE